MEKREGLRAGISSIRQDYRSGGLVSKEGPRLQFNTGSLVKTRQQFYSDYEQENPKPRGGGGRGGAKSRAAYATAQEEAFSNYLGDIATGIGFTPTQDRDAFRAEYEKTNPAPTGRRVYYKVRDAWNAGFNTAFDNYQQSYINDLSAALAAKNKEVAASNAAARAGSGSQNTTSTTGETTMASNADIDRRRRQLAEEAAGRGTTVSGPTVKTIEQVGGRGVGQVAAGTGQISSGETQKVGTNLATQQPDEQVTTVDTIGTMAQPSPIETETISDVAQASAVTPTAETGTVGTESIVENTDIIRTATLEGADVDIKDGAIAQRVVAEMSPEAVAQAAEVTGLDLRRVTRAKEELRTAGIDDLTISQLGNDPKALEAKLMELTDEQRGLVEGLPQEALVSNQMDSLLKGIESGSIPNWAKPAVAAVDQLLAQRGLEASTVGRDALLNTIIQNALPIAQSNAQAIQASIAQEKGIEAQVALQNSQFRQQTALQNAENVFSLNMAQFNADQQRELSNSKFFQTVSLTEASNDQQAAIQNAVLLSQQNIAEATIDQERKINNAKAFLQTDLTNLSNKQQSAILAAQNQQQAILSNQAAQNAAKQFNATSQNQMNQFMAGLAADADKFNATQLNLIKQFNANSLNNAEARKAQRNTEIEKFNASTRNQIEQFNAAVENNRVEFNARNQLAIAQSNAQWRRQIATADTAAINGAAEMATKMNFDLTAQAQANLWQDMRDQASYVFDAADRDKTIVANLTAEFLSGSYSDKAAMRTNFDIMKTLISTLTDYTVNKFI
jgi:hypothetical protein